MTRNIRINEGRNLKVLIVSHNVISETNNMGKTLLSYFKDFHPEEIAEFYIQDKLPKNASVASSYFRISDREALKSVLGKRPGNEYCLTKSIPEGNDELKGAVEGIRQYGRKKNALVYTIRNAVWSLAHWRTKELISWLKKVNPDVIFFMAGDYSFIYKIALEFKKILNKPLVVCCVDDYFLFNRNENSLLGRAQFNSYIRTVYRLMEESSLILTISDSMGLAYSKLFNKECRTLHTSAKKRECANDIKRTKVGYFGNLSFERNKQLIEMGKAIKELKIPGINWIDVYSGEKNPDILEGMTEENGINFHGEIPAMEVAAKMDECIAVIHTESFDSRIRKIVRFSVSTKIADSLLNGPCLIAYGPDDVASIDYLKRNGAAYIINESKRLKENLYEILTNADLRDQIVVRARKLAANNHDEAVNPKKVRKWLEEVVASC